MPTMPTNKRPDSRSIEGKGDDRRDPARRGSTLSKRSIFLVGLGSGVFIVSRWRPLLKGSIKAAVKGGTKAQQIVGRGAENVSDLTREAMAELHAERLEPDKDPG